MKGALNITRRAIWVCLLILSSALGCATTSHDGDAVNLKQSRDVLYSPSSTGGDKVLAIRSVGARGSPEAVAILHEFVRTNRADGGALLEAVNALERIGNKESAAIIRHAFYEDETMPEWPGKVYNSVDQAIEACELR